MIHTPPPFATKNTSRADSALSPLDTSPLRARRSTGVQQSYREPGLIPGRVTRFSQVGIVPDDDIGRRIFSGISRFPAPSFRRRSLLTSITLIGSEDLAVKSRPNLFTRSLYKRANQAKPLHGPSFLEQFASTLPHVSSLCRTVGAGINYTMVLHNIGYCTLRRFPTGRGARNWLEFAVYFSKLAPWLVCATEDDDYLAQNYVPIAIYINPKSSSKYEISHERPVLTNASEDIQILITKLGGYVTNCRRRRGHDVGVPHACPRGTELRGTWLLSSTIRALDEVNYPPPPPQTRERRVDRPTRLHPAPVHYTVAANCLPAGSCDILIRKSHDTFSKDRIRQPHLNTVGSKPGTADQVFEHHVLPMWLVAHCNQIDPSSLAVILSAQPSYNRVQSPAGPLTVSHVGIVPDDFSRISRSPRPFKPTLLHTHFASSSSALKTSLFTATQISSLTHFKHNNIMALGTPEVARVLTRAAVHHPLGHNSTACNTDSRVERFGRLFISRS
ncbi:hypothetical protein PR048_021783 [Dryococelus australis]|uniref:Uncharacterized protein n=1 Tax=Dryococelus australis TaxID=614101 RepID=A0ABQ9GZ56_9NEOP|nr:hypothetical protein PR048_021783 [Dryococelus australis]